MSKKDGQHQVDVSHTVKCPLVSDESVPIVNEQNWFTSKSLGLPPDETS